MNALIWKDPASAAELDEAETPLWFWNDKLEKEELLRQLALKTKIGVRSTNPHARTNGGEGYIGGYLDQEWFDHIRTVVDYKKAHHEKMWLYDEMDWPAGTCNQTITKEEKYREQYITIEKIDIPAGEVFRAQLTTFEGEGLFGIHSAEELGDKALNMVLISAVSGQEADWKQQLIFDMFGPELEFVSEEPAVCYLMKVRSDAYELGGKSQVNYLDAEATGAFLDSTYEKYWEQFAPEFGKSITTVFNDETRMCNPIAWSRSFAETFQAKKGYDIRKKIYQLIVPGEAAGRVRCDYFDVLASLYQENYFGVIGRWCRQHSLKLFAHLLGEETLFGHARYSGDYLRQNRYLDVCGADHLGKGIGSLNIKFTASAAHSYGKKETAVEVFAGCGWDLTFTEYCRMVTWMFQQGMQTIINHGFFYSDRGKRKNDWPPSQFFQWKYFDRMAEGNAMIRRLHYAMTGGMNEADILVYFPMESFWLHYLPDQHYTHAFFHGAFTRDDRAAALDRNVQLFLNGLSSRNMEFELIHQDAVENFAVQDGKLHNQKSGQVFSTLVLPFCSVLPLPMARLCLQYAAAGGQLWLIDTTPSYAMTPAQDPELADIMGKILSSEHCEVLSFDDAEQIFRKIDQVIPHPVTITAGVSGTRNNHPCYPDYLIDPYLHGGEDLDGVKFCRYLQDGKRNTLFMNYGKEETEITVTVVRSIAQDEKTEDGPQCWDPFTGTIQPAEILEQDAEKWVVRLQLPCDHGVFLVADA